MKKFEIIRVAKLKTMAAVKRSGLHTYREIPARNAAPEKANTNYFKGAKSADELLTAVRKRIDTVTNVDAQAVRCLEYIVTASPEQFGPDGGLQGKGRVDYFNAALRFLQDKHGPENIAAIAIHQDEKTPHMVVYAVPVVKVSEKIRKRSVGQKGGGRRIIEQVVPEHSELSCKAFYGGLDSYRQLQDDFHAAVGQQFGLDRGISRVEGRRHKKPAEYYAEKEAALIAAAAEMEQKKKAVADLDVALQEKTVRVSKLREFESAMVSKFSDFKHLTKGKSFDELLTMLSKGKRAMDTIEKRKQFDGHEL